MLIRFPLFLASALLVCAPVQLRAQSPGSVQLWLTSADRSSLLTKQDTPIAFHHNVIQVPTIDIDDTVRYQRMDGFGFALTGGSAELLMRMSAPARSALLKEFFAPDAAAGIGVSYLRVSVGSSDMNEHVFTYDDVVPGEQDPHLKRFSLGPDLADVVPVLREILAINPKIAILASPWSAPSWMKTNDKAKAGSLRPEFYGVYAQYLVKYVQTMAAHGIHIVAITPQNEPLNPKNTPSMVMSATEEATFIGTALGPALRREHLGTGIIVYDHNCDRPDYPLTILADHKASQYVIGSGFHLYEGDVSAMTQVHDAYPAKNIYFTEQMVAEDPKEVPFKIEEKVGRIVVGATRNWARTVLLWNLAADPNDGPHTSDGGCTVCQGAVTLDGDKVTRNLAYYTLAQISKFVRPGSVRIQSSGPRDTDLAEVAFKTPEGKKVLLVTNGTKAAYTFGVHFKGEQFTSTLGPGDVGTYVW
jgi:glucosylceramidase